MVTLLCLWMASLAWIFDRMTWARQRQALIAQENVAELYLRGDEAVQRRTVPGLLWLFGEKYVLRLYITVDPKAPLTDEEVLNHRRLFPESLIEYSYIWPTSR